MLSKPGQSKINEGIEDVVENTAELRRKEGIGGWGGGSEASPEGRRRLHFRRKHNRAGKQIGLRNPGWRRCPWNC